VIDSEQMATAIGHYNDFLKVQLGFHQKPESPEQAEEMLQGAIEKVKSGQLQDAFGKLGQVHGLSDDALLTFQLGIAAILGKKELRTEANCAAYASLIIGLSLQQEQA